MIAKATSGRGRFSEVAKSWGGRKWVLDYSSPSCCHLCHKMGWGRGVGSLPPSSSSSFVVGWPWSLFSTTCCFWLFLPLFLDASFSFWKKFGEKNGVELSQTLQWKGVQVLNNIISYSVRWIYNVYNDMWRVEGWEKWDCCVQQVFMKMWKSRISNYNMSITCAWMIMSILILVMQNKEKGKTG